MFISPEDTAKLKAKVRLLAEMAEREIGPVMVCSWSMASTSQVGRDYSAIVLFRSKQVDAETRRQPSDIVAYGASPEEAIAAAREAIAKRAAPPPPVIDQQTCRPVYPTIAELIEGATSAAR